MKLTPWIFGSLAAICLAGCGGDRRSNDTGATGGPGTESGRAEGGVPTTADTAMSPTTDTSTSAATGTDTARVGPRIHSDTNKPTSKTDPADGDAVRKGADSTAE